jgi:hypothetical protein
MPNSVREGADKSNCHGSGQLAEAIRAIVAVLRSTVAQSRRLAEEQHSIIASTQTTIREGDVPLQAATFRFDLISIDQASPSWLRPK